MTVDEVRGAAPGSGRELRPGRSAAPVVGAPAAPAPTGRAGRTRSTRDTVVDLAAMLLLLPFGLLAVGMTTDREQRHLSPVVAADWWIWVELVVLAVGLVLVWTRRRRPRLLAVVFALLSVVSLAAGAVAGVFLFTVAVHRPARQLAGVTALLVGAGTAYVLLAPPGRGVAWVDITLNAVVCLAIAGWGTAVRHRRQLVASLRERAERAEAEQQLRVDQAKQLERTRIAREMHDVLAHRISLISMHAGALEYRRDASPEQVAEAAAVVRASAHQALEDLRSVLGVLRSGELRGEVSTPEPPQPALRDLSALVEESRGAGARVDLDLSALGARTGPLRAPGASADEALPEVPVALGRTVYRIVQEGLTNACRHAAGSRIVVEVSGAEGEGLEVLVRNRRPVGTPSDGAGGPSARSAEAALGSGTGLVGLRERTELAGGRLRHGWSGDVHELRASLPWPRP